MITDKQGREWLLKKLYDMCYRYLYSDMNGAVMGTAEIPTINNLTGKVQVPIFTIKDFLFKVDGIIDIDGDYLDIEKELGVVDWSKVPVDTPVIVRDNCEADGEWTTRHFAKYENGKVYTFNSGLTSWTIDGLGITSWDNVRLADVDKE